MNGYAVYSSNYKPFDPGCNESGSEDYRYTGKHEDTTGLYYFGARYYNPVLGRFITRDTIFGVLTDPQSQNRYVYCLNNPHKYVDPDGNVAWELVAFGLGLLYMTAKGVARCSQYSHDNPSATFNERANAFFIGFDEAGVQAVASATKILAPVKTTLGKSLTTHLESINNLAGVTGYEEIDPYTFDEKFGDIQQDIIINKVNSLWPNSDILTMDENGMVFVGSKGVSMIGKDVSEPYLLHIDDFKPIDYDNKHDPNSSKYQDPWRYGR